MNNGDSGETDAKGEVSVVTPEPNPFWKQLAEKLVGESITKLEDNAKQIVTLAGVLLGVYFNAIKLSDIKSDPEYSSLLYVAPILLWLISISFIMLSMFGHPYSLNINSSRESKETFEKILRKKYQLIRISSVFLVLSFVALTIALMHYIGILSYHTFEMWQNSSVQLF